MYVCSRASGSALSAERRTKRTGVHMASNESSQDHRSPRETVEAFFEGQANGDANAVAALFSEDATWVTPGDSELVPWVGRRSRDGIGDYMEQQAANAEPTSFELYKILVEWA